MIPTACEFWMYHETMELYVKLRLESKYDENERLLWHDHLQQHEEGYSKRTECLWMEEDGVHWTIMSEGKDCDGRVSDYRHFVCPYLDLEAGVPGLYQGQEPGMVNGYWDDGMRLTSFKLPTWKEVDSECRDYAAEAAGY